MADIEVGKNRPTLTGIGSAWKGRPGAEPQPPDTIEGKSGTRTADGNGSSTAFNVTHGAGYTPSSVQVTPRNQIASVAHWVTGIGATQFTVNFASAPASGTGNVQFDWLVIR